MPLRTTLLASAVALSAALTVAPSAEVSAAPGHHKAPKYQVLLTFDNRESLKPNTRVRDASGHKHAGRVLVAAGGTLRRDSGVVRRSADFPNRCHTCGRAIIEVRDGRGLDPQRRSFTYGAAVRVTKSQATFGSNLVQKGFFNQDGGQWKLQLGAGGVPSCVVFGSAGRIKVDASRGVANGKWHRVSCTRTATGVSVRIDGVIRGVFHGPTGLVANTSPIRVGGKKIDAANKQFHGDLDSVFMRLLP